MFLKRCGRNSQSLNIIKHGSSRPEVFCKKGVLRNFAKFTGKHLCQGLFFNKVAGAYRKSRTRESGPIDRTRDPRPLPGTRDLGPFVWEPRPNTFT